MALRNVRINGDDILRKRSREVSEINNKIRTLLDDMLETMYKEDGIGLAAPQIGVLKRLVVIDLGEGEEVYKMINPEIIKSSGTQTDQEGCLSVPEIKGNVERPKYVTVKYLDENGKETVLDAENVLARCICHEIDHLNGVLFIDKME